MEPRKRKHTVSKDYSGVIAELLKPYGLWAAGPGWFRSCCPVHKGDNDQVFSIRSNGRWGCFKCGVSGDMTALVCRLTGINRAQAAEQLAKHPGAVTRVDIAALQKMLTSRTKTLGYPILPEADIADYVNHCPRYLLTRGFSKAALRKYEIGYSQYTSKVVIPARDVYGNLVGLTYRRDFDNDASQMSKYYHEGFVKSAHLWGFHLWADRRIRRLFIVEGQLDAVRMYQLGYPAVAIMGAHISDEQVRLLSQYCRAIELVDAFDNDTAGAAASATLLRKVRGTRFAFKLSRLKYPGHDPGDLSLDDKLGTVPWFSGMLAQMRRRSEKSPALLSILREG